MNTLKIFISYSHKDTSYLELLMTHLKYLEKYYSFKIWNDRYLKSGANWSKNISRELNQANIAILLISQHFLISDFITKVELPSILKNAQSKGTIVIPIIVTHCMFEDYSKLSSFQSVNTPDKPLEDMKDSELNKIFKDLTNELKGYISLKKEKNIELQFNSDNSYTITQLSILSNLQNVNCVEGNTISEIQKLLKTNNRKKIVSSLEVLKEYELIEKLKVDAKTKFQITLNGRQLCQEIKKVFENGK